MHICDTYNCDYLQHTIFRFYLINFQLNTDFLSQFCVFTVKSPSVTQRSVSQENAFKKRKHPVALFFRKTIGSNNSFNLIEKQFQVFKIAKFEFKVTRTSMAYGQNAPSCGPLIVFFFFFFFKNIICEPLDILKLYHCNHILWYLEMGLSISMCDYWK